MADQNTQDTVDTKATEQATPNADKGTEQGTQGTGPANNPGTPKQFTYAEDRGSWVPPHRLRETTTARTAAETRAAQLEAQLAESNRKLAALAGFPAKDGDEADAEEIREKLHKLVPNLKNLDRYTPEQLDKIDRLLARADQLEETVANQWERHGSNMVGQAHEQIAKEYGDLSERQKGTIGREFTRLIQDAEDQMYAYYRNQGYTNEQIAQSGVKSQLLQRYEAGDPMLVSDFVKQYLEDHAEPIRKRVISSEAARLGNRRLPDGRRTGVVAAGKPKIDYNDPDAFGNALVTARNERRAGMGQ